MKPLDVLLDFQQLAGEFREAARKGDLSAMNEILTKRRDLLHRLSFDTTTSDASSEEETLRVELLRAILEMDREAEQMLEKQREELGAELVSLSSGRRGLEGYQGPSRQSAKWIDERG